jgi:hypothetical protein
VWTWYDLDIEPNFEMNILKKLNLFLVTENFSKFNISSHLRSKIYKITSKKSHSSKTYKQYHELPSISLQFFSFDFVKFSMIIFFQYSINSCTIGLNITKPSLYTSTFQMPFPMVPKRVGALWFGRSQLYKQNKLPSK